MTRLQVWSSGGGTQSAAIAALIVSKELERPDVAVIADTGYEQATTWQYMDEVITPALATVGVKLHRITAQQWATVGLFSKKQHSLLIPAYTTQGQTVGKLPAFCSQEWKKRVVQRWINATYAPVVSSILGCKRLEASPRSGPASYRQGSGDCVVSC